MLPVAILAGGLATRLRPATEKIPKSLLDVNGEPFIVHQLRLLKACGVPRVVLCVGFLGEMVRNVVKDGRAFGLEVKYSFDGPALLGTAGALKRALPLLGRAFLTLYGDSYLLCDYANVARKFEESGKQGRIVAYNKKERTPWMKYIDYGLGAFTLKAFERVPADKAFDLAELYQAILADGELGGMEIQQRFYEIGSAAGLAETARFIALRGAMRA
jgi:NDP-sugar pyrophosphorylase family protein